MGGINDDFTFKIEYCQNPLRLDVSLIHAGWTLHVGTLVFHERPTYEHSYLDWIGRPCHPPYYSLGIDCSVNLERSFRWTAPFKRGISQFSERGCNFTSWQP